MSRWWCRMVCVVGSLRLFFHILIFLFLPNIPRDPTSSRCKCKHGHVTWLGQWNVRRDGMLPLGERFKSQCSVDYPCSCSLLQGSYVDALVETEPPCPWFLRDDDRDPSFNEHRMWDSNKPVLGKPLKCWGLFFSFHVAYSVLTAAVRSWD